MFNSESNMDERLTTNSSGLWFDGFLFKEGTAIVYPKRYNTLQLENELC